MILHSAALEPTHGTLELDTRGASALDGRRLPLPVAADVVHPSAGTFGDAPEAGLVSQSVYVRFIAQAGSAVSNGHLVGRLLLRKWQE